LPCDVADDVDVLRLASSEVMEMSRKFEIWSVSTQFLSNPIQSRPLLTWAQVVNVV
jgi:hypothetical protein